MPYEYLPEIAGGDVAFRAWGETLEEVIVTAGDAMMGVMVDNPTALSPQRREAIEAFDTAEDLLLVQVLQELLFYKDACSLLLRLVDARVEREGETLHFTGHAAGEPIDTTRRPLATDVKAVTMHRLAVRRTAEGWAATVVLDV